MLSAVNAPEPAGAVGVVGLGSLGAVSAADDAASAGVSTEGLILAAWTSAAVSDAVGDAPAHAPAPVIAHLHLLTKPLWRSVAYSCSYSSASPQYTLANNLACQLQKVQTDFASGLSRIDNSTIY